MQLNPNRIFLLDGVGALLSAFLLGIVLVRLEHIFGIPIKALHILAVVPCFFVIYDLYSYFLVKKKIRYYIIVIALMNIGYILLSIGLAIQHCKEITLFGWCYIIGEIIILMILIVIELKLFLQLNQNKSQ